MGIFHFLPTGLFPHLPFESRDTARRPAAAHETNGRIPNFDLAWNIKYLNLSVEFFRLAERRVLLVTHDVTPSRHVVFVEAFDVETDVVAWVCEVNSLVVPM